MELTVLLSVVLGGMAAWLAASPFARSISEIVTLQKKIKELKGEQKAIIDFLNSTGNEVRITLDTNDENSIRNFLTTIKEVSNGKPIETN